MVCSAYWRLRLAPGSLSSSLGLLSVGSVRPSMFVAAALASSFVEFLSGFSTPL